MISRRILLGSAAAAGWFGSSPQSAWAAATPPKGAAATTDNLALPPTPADFVRYPLLSAVAISPDGETLAVVHTETTKKSEDETEFTTTVTFRNAETFADINVVLMKDNSVAAITWIDNDRVIMNLRPTSMDFLEQKGAANHPQGFVVMHKTTHRAVRMPNGTIVDFMPSDPNHIMQRIVKQGLWTLSMVDTNTGAAADIDQGTLFTVDWYIQDGKPIVRIDEDGVGSKVRIYYGRDPEKKTWRVIGRYRVDGINGNDFEILGSSDTKPGIVWVATNAPGENFRPLREYNVFTSTWGETLSRQDGDAVGVTVDGAGAYVATGYVDDIPFYDCVDPQMTADMAQLAKAFPNASVHIHNISNDHNRMVCTLEGPNDAGSFIFYDRKSGKVRPFGDMRPWLTQARLPTALKLTVHSKDGTAIRAYLTVPVGGGKKPLVVMPHGGPEARDMISFDLWAQAFAAQGWYVLQPNFRGSTGYGMAFKEAGYRHWSTRVMEDVDASIQEAFDKASIDRDKVAIMGASYGGYVALMNAIRNPSMYKAVIGASGVYDLLRSLARDRRQGEADLSYLYWKRAIGDPDADKEAIRDASPITHVAALKAPVMLIHGYDDDNVNIEQSQLMAQAIRNAKGQVDFHEIQDMGHGPSNNAQMFQVVDLMTDFLKKYLV